MADGARKFWLFKSEPFVFSIDDLSAAKGKRTSWEGVRNYHVRNMLRDDMKKGDGVLFYHSRVDPMVVAGAAEIFKEGYPDHFALDPEHKYFDAKSTSESPTWYMVDIVLKQTFKTPVTRDQLKSNRITSEMAVMSKGSRLSITPVTEEQWLAVHELAGVKPK